MRRRNPALKLLLILTLPLTLAGIGVHAGDGWTPFSSPRIETTVVAAGDPVVYFATWDSCGGLGEPLITRSGQVVTITQPVVAVCGLPPPAVEIRYPLGPFAPGNYRVHLVPCSGDDPANCHLVGTSPADVAFSVTGAQEVQAVPALDVRSSGILILGLALAGMFLVRRRQTS